MKKLLFTAAVLSFLGAGMIFAQDFDEYEESADPKLNISGEVGASGRVWVTKDELKSKSKGSESEVETNAYVNLDLEYAASASDLSAKLKFDASSIKDYPEDIIEEFVARGYFADGALTIEAGKEKLVWGKGDKQHVLDNFNANDYTDFVIPDYIDRRIAEPMFRIAVAPSYMNDYLSNIKVEGVWTPMMTADRFAGTGSKWYPAAQATLTDTVEGLVKGNLAELATADVEAQTKLSVVATALQADFTNVILQGAYAQAQANMEEAHTAFLTALTSASSFDANDLYSDNIKTLKYGQAGARVTGTFMGIDLGLSYYYGHYKQPSANVSQLVTAQGMPMLTAAIKPLVTAGIKQQIIAGAMADGMNATTAAAKANNEIAAGNYDDKIDQMTEATAIEQMGNFYNGSVNENYGFALPSLNYDQLQVFGVEAAFVLPTWLLGLNTRWEFAYNLTEDTTGDNPWVKNNSIGWVAGFDRDLPIHNININFQNVGKYVLKSDKIKQNEHFKEYDVDYNTDDKYTNNKFILNISDKFDHEKLTIECTGVYILETKGLLVMPKIEYIVADGLAFSLSGAFIRAKNKNCEFYNFTADAPSNYKAFVQLAGKYQF